VPLTEGERLPGYSFVNHTTQEVCDVLVSTLRLRDGSDPDIEGGPVIIKREPGGQDLQWIQTPASGDGVKEVKMVAPGPGACIPVGDLLSVSLTLDSAASVDTLTVTPTNAAGEMVLGDGGDGHDPVEQHDAFDGYYGLPGSRTARLVSTNGLSQPVGSGRAFSPDCLVTDVAGPSIGGFDVATGEFRFGPPVPPGGTIDYTLTFDCPPIVDGPPPPLPPRRLSVELLGIRVPTSGPIGTGILALALGVAGWLAVRRIRLRKKTQMT
jgi:hypothetical protein